MKSQLKWYNPKNERACFWLACRLANKYSKNFIDIDNFDEAYKYINQVLEDNEISSKKYKIDFLKHEEKFDFSWAKNMSIGHANWFLRYINKTVTDEKSKIKPPIVDLIHDHKKSINKAIYIFDSLDNDVNTLNFIYKKIKSAYSQKKKREENKKQKRKQCNISLSKDHFNMLNDICNTNNFTKQEVIESLIYLYHDRFIDTTTLKILPAPKTLPLPIRLSY